jgi:hypothetical protein
LENSDRKDFAAILERLPLPARKLLCVIARQIYHGALRSKTPGTATMPEIHEACGLDVDQMISALRILKEVRLIEAEGDYPFEEIRWTGDGVAMEAIHRRCEAAGIPLEVVVAELRFDLLK